MAGDSSQRNLVVRFRGIGSRSGAPAEPGRRWEANYKLKLGQALASRVPSGAARGLELRRRENKSCLAVFGSMMTGALVPVANRLTRATGIRLKQGRRTPGERPRVGRAVWTTELA